MLMDLIAVGLNWIYCLASFCLSVQRFSVTKGCNTANNKNQHIPATFLIPERWLSPISIKAMDEAGMCTPLASAVSGQLEFRTCGGKAGVASRMAVQGCPPYNGISAAHQDGAGAGPGGGEVEAVQVHWKELQIGSTGVPTPSQTLPYIFPVSVMPLS